VWCERSRQFTHEFKFQVVGEVEASKSRAQVAREDHVHPTVIWRWQKEHQRQAGRALAGHVYRDQAEAHMADFERMIGQRTLATALRKKALLQLEARHQEQTGSGGRAWARSLRPRLLP
jgi:transposase-like protein